MTHIKQVDQYIQKSLLLLKSDPDRTTISITYTHSKPSKKTLSKTDIKNPLKRNVIKFKTYNDKSGISLNFKTYKIKEFSRLLNSLGPKGCSITKRKSNTTTAINEGNGEKEVKEIVQLDGLSAVMTNVEFKEDEVMESAGPVDLNATPSEVETGESTTAVTAATGTGEGNTESGNKKSKKSKKKGGKKR